MLPTTYLSTWGQTGIVNSTAEKAAQYGVTAKFNSKFPTSEDLYTIAQLIANGSLRSEIDSIFPLSEANQAHQK
uniref:zinc-binding dehydrogenase n=1 Tax=Paenibacillus sp. Y5S-9 TaxID=3122489 RepID=UPI00403F7E9F